MRIDEWNPIWHFLAAIISIFAAEIIVMFILSFLPSFSPVTEAFVDGLLLSLFSLPLFYLFLLRPLFLHIRKLHHTEEALRKSHEKLEERVREQTAHLLRANEILQGEIDRREQAVLAQDKAENVFRSIFEMSHDGIFVVDEYGIIQAVNPAGKAMFGYNQASLEQEPLTIIMPERYRDDHTKGLNHAVGHGKSAYFGKTMEFHGLRKDGGEFPLELNISQWKSNGGLYFSGVIRDITERKDAEKSIRNSEAKLNAIFNSTLDGILVADTESKKFLTGNKAICEMLGYTLQELVELEVDDIHPAESLRYIHEQFELQARKEIKISAEIPVKRKDGTIFVADIVLSPMQISDKNFLIGVFRDATQRHEAEARIRQSQKLEAIGTLAGGIAHDFNNILAAILGYGELALEDSKQGTAVHDELQQVIKAGNRARELIKQILTLSRQTTMETSPQRIQVIVKEVLKLLRATIPTTIEIRQNIDNDCDPVLADPTQIHQILMNLCTNAFHAMEQTGGVLEVALQRIDLAETDERRMPELKPGRYVQLDVIDTGPGMIKDVMDHIFEPYYTTKPLGKGSGLGLAVVHGIVESHGGKIGCKSEPGSGTVFSVFLPVVEMTFETGYEKKPVLPTGNERILFVDDEESLALLGKKKLEPLGYTVFPVTSSTQALQMVQDSPQGYDLVITDQTMPRMSGEILAQKLFAIRPDIPVILCTGFSSVITEELAKSIGIKAFLIKPVDNQVLAETIRKVLDS